MKCDGTRADTRFRLSAKQTSPFKSAGASVQPTTGGRDVRISGSNAGYTMFRGSVKCTGYPLHPPVSPSPPRPCVTVCLHISTGVYNTGMVLNRTSSVLPRLSLYQSVPFYRVHRCSNVTSSVCSNLPRVLDIVTQIPRLQPS